MSDLKLIALDAEDLGVVSAHVQDAVVRVGDMAYLPRERRFAALLNRFDWADAVAGQGRRRGALRRVRSAVRFERVRGAKLQNIDLKAKSQVLSLLAIGFEAGDGIGGVVTLLFAGGAAIQLEIDCIEAELRDLGAAWKARAMPDHGGGSGSGSGVRGRGSPE